MISLTVPSVRPTTGSGLDLPDREATPIVPVASMVNGAEATIHLKLESANRWGSIKDRTAIALLDSVAGRLRDRGATLIESTSGNLGVALAALAGRLDRRFIAVVDPSLSPALAQRMVAAGAQLDVVDAADPQGSYLDARLARVSRLLEEIPGGVWTDQYHNPANVMAHYQSTGPELLAQRPDLDLVFVAVSTGGTLAGVSRYLRRHAPAARIVAVDVPGSQVFCRPAGTRLLTGIGASRRSSFLRPGDWDEVMLIEDTLAIAVCHELYASTGIHLGGSSGAVVAACVRYLQHRPQALAPVCLCADGGATYAQTIYNPAWVAAKSVELSTGYPPIVFA